MKFLYSPLLLFLLMLLSFCGDGLTGGATDIETGMATTVTLSDSFGNKVANVEVKLLSPRYNRWDKEAYYKKLQSNDKGEIEFETPKEAYNIIIIDSLGTSFQQNIAPTEKKIAITLEAPGSLQLTLNHNKGGYCYIPGTDLHVPVEVTTQKANFPQLPPATYDSILYIEDTTNLSLAEVVDTNVTVFSNKTAYTLIDEDWSLFQPSGDSSTIEEISFLFTDSDSCLYIGTTNNGVFRKDSKGKSSHFPYSKEEAIIEIDSLDNGKLILLTTTKVLLLNPEEEPAYTDLEIPSSGNHKDMWHSKGILYVATDNSLWHYINNKWELLGYKGSQITAGVTDSSGNIWLATQSGLAVVLDSIITQKATNNNQFDMASIKMIGPLSTGALFAVDAANGVWQTIGEDWYYAGNPPSAEPIFTTFLSSGNGVFIAQNRYIYKFTVAPTIHISETMIEALPIYGNPVQAIHRGSDEQLYVAVKDVGIFVCSKFFD